MIVFYWSPRSSATRIYWALEELGIPHEKVKIDTQAGDQRKPDYLALNPNGKVPLIVDDGPGRRRQHVRIDGPVEVAPDDRQHGLDAGWPGSRLGRHRPPVPARGGSAWESNPPRRAERSVTGFEDRGRHRPTRTPT